jgi:hypothetical protein
MPHGGGIAQEANAPGKAQGYADVGTVVWMVGPPDGGQAMSVNDGWNSVSWFTLEQELFRLPKRIYRASICGDLPRRGMDDNHQTSEEPDAGKLARPVLKPSGGSDPFA